MSLLQGQPLREADIQRLSRAATCLPVVVMLKIGCRIVLRRQISEGWVNGNLCEVLEMTPTVFWYVK